jgi:hypothetical protein
MRPISTEPTDAFKLAKFSVHDNLDWPDTGILYTTIRMDFNPECRMFREPKVLVPDYEPKFKKFRIRTEVQYKILCTLRSNRVNGIFS